MDADTHDVAIIGGGAAGLSAALVLGRARRSVVVIDAGAPRNAPAAHMQGFLSRDGMSPADFLDVARAEARHYGVEILDDRVVGMADDLLLALASGGVVRSRRVLIASGAVDELPDIEGARERWGRDFLHCPYCHGWEVRDQPIGVLGTGPGSVEHAHLLRQWSDDVVFLAHATAMTASERMTLEARQIVVVDGKVERLVVTEDRLRAVQLADGRMVPRNALFIRPALRAHPDACAGNVGCARAGGLLQTEADGRTSVPGVWAAGNATNPRAQVITAAGEGSAAAIAINNDLVREDVETARQKAATAPAPDQPDQGHP